MLITNPIELFGRFTYRDRVVGTLLGVPVEIAPSDPSRVAMMVSSGTGTAWIRPYLIAANAVGIQLLGTQGPVYINYTTFPGVVGSRWTAFGSAAGIQVFVAEVLYSPKGREQCVARTNLSQKPVLDLHEKSTLSKVLSLLRGRTKTEHV